MRLLRRTLVTLLFAGLLVAPVVWLGAAGLGVREAMLAAVVGFAAALDAVGWVLVPQAVLAVAVLGAALQRVVYRLAGAQAPAPPWIDPAIESALLLGMLGTIHGMVNGFAGLAPEELQPGPLINGLGTALRSSFVGFGIALVGVWTREAQPASVAAG